MTTTSAKPAAARPSDAPRQRRLARRRVVNLPLLVATVGLLAIVLPAGWLWHGYRQKQAASAMLNRVEQLEAAGAWAQAASYLQRYLRERPLDVENRVRLIEDFARVAESGEALQRLGAMLYETLGLAPHRTDLQARLADNRLQVGDAAEARLWAEKTLAGDASPGERAQAQRVLALARYQEAVQTQRESELQAAVSALRTAQAGLPGDRLLTATLADCYRTKPEFVGPEVADPVGEANRIVDAMVAAAPDDLQVRVARFLYRRTHGLPGAADDLAAARTLDPDDPMVLLFAATEKAQEEADPRRPEAKAMFRRLIEISPKDPRGYLALAELELRGGDREAALDAPRSGRTATGRDDFDLNRTYATLLIDGNQLDQAQRAVDEAAAAFNQSLDSAPAQLRERELQLQLLRARLALAEKRTAEARDQLRLLVASRSGDAQFASYYVQAYEMLARAATAAGDRDEAAGYWRRLAGEFPNDARAAAKAAKELRRLGRPGDAVPILRQLAEGDDAARDTQAEYLAAMLQQQLELPPSRRDWRRFLERLDALRADAANDYRIAFAAGDYYAALGDPRSRSQGLELLAAAEPHLGDDANRYSALALLYQRLGDDEASQRAWSRYEQLQPEGLEKNLRRAERMVRRGELAQARELLEADRASTAASDLESLELALISLHALAGELLEARRDAEALAAANPRNELYQGAAAELALATGDLAAVAQREQQAAALEGRDQLRWEVMSLRRRAEQLSQMTPVERDDFQRDLRKLRENHPDFPIVQNLAGRLAEENGDAVEAIAAYEKAIELGDRSLENIQRLTILLYRLGRYPEGLAYQEYFRSGQTDVLELKADSLADAMERNRAERALTAARDLAAAQPQSAAARAWLGGLLGVRGDAEEANAAFAQAVDDFPNDMAVRTAQLAHLLRTEQRAAARVAVDQLTRLAEQSDRSPEAAARQLLLAMGYDALGDPASARRVFEAAVAAGPHDAYLRERYVNFLASRDVAEARRQCEALLEIDPKNPRARRILATLLAAGGGEDDWRRAQEMLEDARDADAGDYRLRAVLLARRGRDRLERVNNLEAARRIVTQAILIGGEGAADIDRILLADLARQQAVLVGEEPLLEEAAEQWRVLVARDPPNPAYLLRGLDFLVAAIEGVDGVQLAPAARTRALDDARQVLEKLLTLQPSSAPLAQRLATLTLQTRLLALEGRNEAAVEAIEQMAAQEPGSETPGTERAQFHLAMGNLFSAAGRFEQAEASYRKLAAINPRGYLVLAAALAKQGRLEEAVQACLSETSPGSPPSPEAMSAVCELLASNLDQSELFNRLRPTINEAVEAHSQDLALTTAAAVLHAAYGENERALELFERLAQLTPDNPLVLNNLATMLADLPLRRREALKHVARAIAVAGRLPDLLDTQGTILIYEQRYDEAIKSLEEAVAGKTVDPRYYFHLAVAYGKADQLPRAREALAQAKARGLDATILTAGDQQARRELEARLESR
jgi:tetratricopeptide (TPR) repeat protein